MPAPPYSSSTVMPCRPSSPICGQSSRGKVFGRVDLGGARRDLRIGEAAHAVAQHVGRFAQAEIEAVRTVGRLAAMCVSPGVLRPSSRASLDGLETSFSGPSCPGRPKAEPGYPRLEQVVDGRDKPGHDASGKAIESVAKSGPGLGPGRAYPIYRSSIYTGRHRRPLRARPIASFEPSIGPTWRYVP